ncbi:MAG: Nif3-like dinuclear metal center hexameric protein [Thermoleophilia bacterium]|nr:Nif3-like dinuclear metal center hexameric protein [Thermoleophilia bacterium]
MTATVAEILEHAETLLDAHAFSDFCPVGLQVAGRATQVEAIATSVSSTRDAFERAEAMGAQLLLCHHGLFWKGMSQVVDPVLRDRLEVLFRGGITLAGYHLCLDAHPELGNNALIADALELSRTGEPFAEHGGRAIGLVGEVSGDGEPFDAFVARVQSVLGGRAPLVLGVRPDRVRRVAVCSGGSASNIADAAALGCDVFLTGEPREDTQAFGRELGITLLAGGHHATEVFGIRALGEHLAGHFGVRHVFLDADNPV